MSGWLTPQSLAAIAVTLLFVAVALQRPARAVLAYAVLGAMPPVVQLGAFSGRTISQGLLLAEALATVLFGAWIARRGHTGSTRPAFETPLLAFVAVCLASMIGVLVMPDRSVERSVSTAVSFGQVMLVLWPVAVYLAAAEFISTTSQLLWLQRAMLLLAVPQVVLIVAPRSWTPYMAWAWTFATFAAPFAAAAALASKSVVARAGYALLVLLPLVRGVIEGKAFLYGFVIVAVTTIVWVRASRLAATVLVAAASIALVAVVIYGDQVLFAPFEVLLNKERTQLSYGGRSGRSELALAALSIWQQAPILGVGPGNSYVYMLQRSPIGTPHNQYLNLLVEFGILGLLTWLAFLVSAMRAGFAVYSRAATPQTRTFALGWLGMFMGMIAGGITGDFMVHSIRNGGIELFSGYYLQWVLLGAMAAIPRIEALAGARRMPAAPRPRFWRARPRPAAPPDVQPSMV